MRRFKYLRVRVPQAVIRNHSKNLDFYSDQGLSVVRANSRDISLEFTATRNLSVVKILADGSVVRTNVPTMERYLARLRVSGGGGFLVLEDAPRGTRIQDDILRILCRDDDYYFEPLQITTEMISKHVANFDLFKLVTAKVRDLRLSDSVVCRIEVSSKEGVGDELNRLVQGKFHRLDSMTFEIIHQFQKGLITYSSGGVLRVADSLADEALNVFEDALI